MAYQILQIKDDLGNIVDLGVVTPENNVAIRNYDQSVHGTLKNKFGASLGGATSFSTPGNHDLIVPTTGKRVRLRWLAMATSEGNTAENIVTVLLGVSTIYIWPMGAPGAFSHGSVREGAVNEKVIVNTSNSQPVYINYEYEEF